MRRPEGVERRSGCIAPERVDEEEEPSAKRTEPDDHCFVSKSDPSPTEKTKRRGDCSQTQAHADQVPAPVEIARHGFEQQHAKTRQPAGDTHAEEHSAHEKSVPPQRPGGYLVTLPLCACPSAGQTVLPMRSLGSAPHMRLRPP